MLERRHDLSVWIDKMESKIVSNIRPVHVSGWLSAAPLPSAELSYSTTIEDSSF